MQQAITCKREIEREGAHAEQCLVVSLSYMCAHDQPPLNLTVNQQNVKLQLETKHLTTCKFPLNANKSINNRQTGQQLKYACNHGQTHTHIVGMYDYFYFSPAHDEINIEIARPLKCLI